MTPNTDSTVLELFVTFFFLKLNNYNIYFIYEIIKLIE
jgi:hypothetical protein